MTYMPLRTVTIDLCNPRGQIFSRTEFAPSGPALPSWQPCVAAGLPAGQPCAHSRQPCAANLAALRCHPGSPALPSWQPCAAALRGSRAATLAARWQPCAAPAALRGSPGRGLFREVRGGASTPPLHPSHAQNGEAHARLRGS